MKGRRRPGRLSDLFGVAAAVTAVAVAVFLLYGAFQFSRTLVAVSSDPLRDLQLLQSPVTAGGPAPLPGVAGKLQRGERLNLLLLGYGGPGHDGPYLTDSIMVVSFDPSGTATFLSVPRDLWVTLPRSPYSEPYQAKVNQAFSVGANEGDRDAGMRLAAQAVSDVIGVPIDRVVAVDFAAFRTAVDALGGIDLTVETAFDADYPRSDFDDDLGWITVSFKAGAQHMDGETALRFTRARYADGPEGSDFARAARQQQVILAAKDKVVANDAAPRLFSLLDALRENVRTDLSFVDLQGLAELARTYDDGRSIHAALTPDNVLREADVEFADGVAFVLLPKTQGFDEVHQYVRRLFDFPASLAESPNLVVRASSRRADAAEAAADRLRDLGFGAVRVTLTSNDPPASVVRDGGNAPQSAAFIASFLGGATVSPTDAATATELVIDLGADWVAPREGAQPVFVPTPEPSPSPSVTPPPSATPSPTPRPSIPRTPSPTPLPADGPRG